MDEEIKKILEEHEKRIQKLEEFINRKEKMPIKEFSDVNSCAKKLSQKLGVTEEQIKYIFDFNNDDLNLICNIEGKNEGEKQFKATICILTAYYYCYNKYLIKSQDLRKKLEWLGIKSLANLSTNLVKYKRFIISQGKPKSPEFDYKITFPGLKEGEKIIKELISSQS